MQLKSKNTNLRSGPIIGGWSIINISQEKRNLKTTEDFEPSVIL
jgi:hypothetical protein